MNRPWLMMVAILLGAGTARASGFFDPEVRVTNLKIIARDAKTATIRFDVWWEDSWRHEINHDAAWVFFKARADAPSTGFPSAKLGAGGAGKAGWRHVRLAADRVLNPTGYSGGTGTAIELVVPNGKDGYTGMFVRRAAPHIPASLAASNVSVVVELDVQKVDIRAFGLLMVYVGEGPFYLGSGGAEVKGFYQYTDGNQSTRPYRVTGPGAIPVGPQADRLWARDQGLGDDGREIPATFPNGYAAFYCMNDRLKVAEYADFLNTLDEDQAAKRYSERVAVRAGEPPNRTYASVGEWCCPMLSWADVAAYAAWAGLRPMTELEWVKAIRGPRVPLSEDITLSYWGINVPVSWWDYLLHDGVAEARVVTAGNVAGCRFMGTHGGGTPALPADWPGESAAGTGMLTVGVNNAAATRLSDRRHAADGNPEWNPPVRFRCVRTAPVEKVR